VVLDRCPLCDSKRFKLAKEDYATKRHGRRFVVPGLEVYHCETCGQGVLTNEAMSRIEEYARQPCKRAASPR
jgi:YgiT-type zinc finger domain-containing protein